MRPGEHVSTGFRVHREMDRIIDIDADADRVGYM